MPTEEVAPEDPVAAWEADHTAILPAEGIGVWQYSWSGWQQQSALS